MPPIGMELIVPILVNLTESVAKINEFLLKESQQPKISYICKLKKTNTSLQYIIYSFSVCLYNDLWQNILVNISNLHCNSGRKREKSLINFDYFFRNSGCWLKS